VATSLLTSPSVKHNSRMHRSGRADNQSTPPNTKESSQGLAKLQSEKYQKLGHAREVSPASGSGRQTRIPLPNPSPTRPQMPRNVSMDVRIAHLPSVAAGHPSLLSSAHSNSAPQQLRYCWAAVSPMQLRRWKAPPLPASLLACTTNRNERCKPTSAHPTGKQRKGLSASQNLNNR
jgi:hypothetical protein